MFNDKDFMGGMFDFDGNGKTTLDEQYVAYKIYEEKLRKKTIPHFLTTSLRSIVILTTIQQITKAQKAEPSLRLLP